MSDTYTVESWHELQVYVLGVSNHELPNSEQCTIISKAIAI